MIFYFQSFFALELPLPVCDLGELAFLQWGVNVSVSPSSFFAFSSTQRTFHFYLIYKFQSDENFRGGWKLNKLKTNGSKRKNFVWNEFSTKAKL